MFVDFMGVCFDQIFNQAAKFKYMFGGKAVTPVVIRTMYGAGFRAASQHSQCLYPLFTHIPGLKVVLPSNAYEAKGLLIQAIRDDDPVIFFEHKAMYDETAEVPDERVHDPVRRGERHAARATTSPSSPSGRMVNFSNQVADKLAKERIGVHRGRPAHDLAAGHRDHPGDRVEETGRVVVVDEAHPRCNMAADISALICQEAFDDLKAPIKMVTAPHCPVPFSPALEDLYVPEPGEDRGGGARRHGESLMAGEIHSIVMPKWGLAMEEGTVTAWQIAEGAVIAKGQEIADIETSKIANVFESPVSGKVRRLVAPTGETLPVGALLAVVADDKVGRRRNRSLRHEVQRGAEGAARRPRPARRSRNRRWWRSPAAAASGI